MAERATLSEAAALMSERLQQEGMGTSPEFETEAEAPAEERAAEAGAEAVQEDATTQAEAGAEDDGAGDEERFELPGTVHELSELLGLEEGALYGLQVNVNLGDESRPMTIEELKERATAPVRDEVERQRWEDHKRAQQDAWKQQESDLASKREQAETLARVMLGDLDAAENSLAQQYQALLANSEYQSRDPQGYQVALMRQQAQLQQVQQQKQGLLQRAGEMREAAIAEQQEALQQAQASGRKRLRELIPEWSDDEGFKTGAANLTKWMKSQMQATDEEIGNILDPRILYMAEMARRYHDLQEQAKTKPKPSPTARMKPGAQAVRLPKGRKAEIDAMGRLKKSGDIRDATDVLRQRLGQR